MPVATSEPRLAGFWTPDCSSLPPWAVGLPSGRFGCVVSEPRWVPAFPAALAQFFAVGCVAYIALRAAVGSPGLAPRSGYTRMQLGQVRPPWPLRGRGDRGLLLPPPPPVAGPVGSPFLAPRSGYTRKRVGRVAVATFEAARRISSNECIASGGHHARRHLRGRSGDLPQ